MTQTPEVQEIVAANQKYWEDHAYPGRFLFAGADADGNPVLGTGITVRSKPNQGRYYKYHPDTGRVSVEPLGEPPPDPELTLYDAMLRDGNVHIFGNGRQTENALKWKTREGFIRSIVGHPPHNQYEPDGPPDKDPLKMTNTPRITACLERTGAGDLTDFLLLRRSDGSEQCEWVHTTARQIEPGFLRVMATYAANGNPPPSWDRPPIVIPTHPNGACNARAIAQYLRRRLPDHYFVALAVKVLHGEAEETHIENAREPGQE
jgi:hypothetical protein